jgi:hypothetical protein
MAAALIYKGFKYLPKVVKTFAEGITRRSPTGGLQAKYSFNEKQFHKTFPDTELGFKQAVNWRLSNLDKIAGGKKILTDDIFKDFINKPSIKKLTKKEIAEKLSKDHVSLNRKAIKPETLMSYYVRTGEKAKSKFKNYSLPELKKQLQDKKSLTYTDEKLAGMTDKQIRVAAGDLRYEGRIGAKARAKKNKEAQQRFMQTDKYDTTVAKMQSKQSGRFFGETPTEHLFSQIIRASNAYTKRDGGVPLGTRYEVVGKFPSKKEVIAAGKKDTPRDSLRKLMSKVKIKDNEAVGPYEYITLDNLEDFMIQSSGRGLGRAGENSFIAAIKPFELREFIKKFKLPDGSRLNARLGRLKGIDRPKTFNVHHYDGGVGKNAYSSQVAHAQANQQLETVLGRGYQNIKNAERGTPGLDDVLRTEGQAIDDFTKQVEKLEAWGGIQTTNQYTKELVGVQPTAETVIKAGYRGLNRSAEKNSIIDAVKNNSIYKEKFEPFGFKDGGRIELNEGGTSGIELPDFNEFLEINENQNGLIGEEAVMKSIKDFFKSRGRPNYAKGGSIRELRGGSSYNNDVGMFQSIFSGIGAGIIDIPRGAFSLGASLVDLGLGTNSAARVEKFFDDLTTLDEKAEATTAGKITRIMTNLGIPGTYAFKAGSSLAKNALTAKKAGSYWKPTKTTAGQLEKTLTNKGRMLTTLGGAGGIGISDAIFVGDAERVGTLGDAFNIGPTQLAENDENVASRTVMNRIKFGLDSAMLGGIIGGTGTAISQAVKRSNNLNRNNDFIDKILEYTTPQGKKTKEFFEMEREMIGLRSADVNRAQELHRQIDKQIDALYPFVSRATGFGVQKERDAVVKVINDALVSSKNGPKVTAIKEDGVTVGANFTLGDMSEKALQEVRKLKLKDPDEIIRIMQQSRGIMDASFTDIGSNIFKFGRGTKEAAADTLERFDKFRKAFETKSLDYINDTYQIFGNKNSEALKSFRPGEEAITNAKELFKQLSVLRTGKKLTDEEAAFEVERILESSRKQNKFLTEGEALPLIKDESGFLKDIAVKDWNKEYLPLNKIAGEVSEDVLVNGLTPRKIIDNLFGKIEDPSATILSTLGDLSLVRRKHEFFGDLFNTMNGKQFFADRRDAARIFGENNVGEKPIQMLATNPGGKLNIEAVNPLNGMYTSKGIQEALEGVNSGWFSFTEGDNMFSSFYNNFILYPKATSQLAKTVLSPITHARNLISAGAFSAANGIIPLMNKEALDEAMGAFTQVGARGSEAANKRYRELLRLGVVNKNARLGDLEDLLADVNFGSKASQIRALRSFTKTGSKLKEVATDAYTAEDDFWKIFTFASERSRIDKALQKAGIDRSAFATSADNDLGRAFGSVDEYLDEAAANIVRNNVPNYDYVSKFIKDLRKAPLGNFVSFPAEIIRTSVNILGKGLKEFNYIDPVTKTRPFRSIGMQRMAGFGATAVAIPYGTVEAFKAAYDVSGVEMDALRRFVPDWSKNSTLIPIKDDDGNFKYIDFSHANAYDTMIRPFKTIMNAVADGRTDNDTIMEDLLQGVVESTSELGSPFISESIWTQSVSDIFLRGGRTRDGRRLYTEQTPFGDRVAKAIYHMTESQLPGSLAQGKRLLQSVNKDPDKYGRTYDLTDEIGGIAGLRAVAVDPVTSMKFKIASFRTGINNARREFTSPLLRGGAVTPEQIVDRYKIANESLYKVQKEMAQDYYGAQILGASPKALRNEFKDRVSDSQLRSIIRGDFKPFIPSENIEQAFRDNASKIGQQDPYRQARTTINQIARQYSQLKLFSDFLPDIPNPFSAMGVGLPNLGITQSSLPRLNTNINSIIGGSSNTNTNQTIQKGQRVFGSNDPVFGG